MANKKVNGNGFSSHRKPEGNGKAPFAPVKEEFLPEGKVYLYLGIFSIGAAAAILRDFKAGSLIGGFAICCMLMVLFYRDMLRYRPKFIRDEKKLFLLGLLVVGTLVLMRACDYILQGLGKGFAGIPPGTFVYAIPVAAGAMLVMLLFESHIAIMFSFVISVLAGIWLRDPAYVLYAFLGSIMAAFSVIRCKKRTQILKAGINLAAVNMVAAMTILLYREQLVAAEAGYSLLFAAASALGTIAVVSIALPILEYLFDVTTDISLLELLDLEHPLMKTMMITAPGTYHHSIIVGNLVEAAAEQVGVNPLLARVSAYYHDVGKIKMPEYFVENQSAGASKHDRLTPHMSSMVLISHVKEGVDLASHYKLPKPVLDIIRQHHGNSLITYFYQKAKEKSEELPEDEYKYPGPRPQSKVAALVMMADAVEAASRVLTDPTPARVSALVNKVINHIFLEGQLDDCELTLKDIQAIKDKFVYIITGILHRRVDYPGFDFTGGTESGGPDRQPAKADTGKYPADKERQPQAAPSAWD